MKRKTRNYLIFFGILAVVIAWTAFVIYVGPQTVVDYIGVTNSYVVAFIFASLGGLSSLTSTSYFTIIITLAAGGVNPLYLGLVAGVGVTIGDIIFYYFGSRGREVLSRKWKDRVDIFSDWLNKKPKWFVPSFIYVYTGFFPLPHDVLTISISLTGYPLKKVILPLILGNITISILISYLSSIGIQYFF